MLLMIDACLRKDSRTRRLAEAAVSQLLRDGETRKTELLYGVHDALPEPDTNMENAAQRPALLPLSGERIALRDRALRTGDFSDPYFDRAKDFAAADTIVIAAPYWDLSFPAVLKLYFENICVNGLAFRYNEYGAPVGLCRAGHLYYVTTAGGEIGAYNFGYDYIRALTTGLLGVRAAHCIRAVGLDLMGTDAEAVLSTAINSLSEML